MRSDRTPCIDGRGGGVWGWGGWRWGRGGGVGVGIVLGDQGEY